MSALAVIFVPVGCSSSVTSETMTQIKPGMKADQVETILGRPARIGQSESTGLTGEIDYFPAPTGEGRVVFVNGAVFKVEFVSGGRS